MHQAIAEVLIRTKTAWKTIENLEVQQVQSQVDHYSEYPMEEGEIFQEDVGHSAEENIYRDTPWGNTVALHAVADATHNQVVIYVVKTEGVQELTIQPVQAFGSAVPLKGIPVLSPISNTPLQGCVWNVHSYENDRPRKADKAKSQYTNNTV